MCLSKFCFSAPFLLLILECSLLQKLEHIVPVFCVPFDEIGMSFSYYLGTKWSFIAKRGTNCSEFRIPSATNWFLMNSLGTIVPKNVFLLITWEHAFIKIRNKMVLYCYKGNQLFRIPNPERTKLDLNR